MKRDLGAGTVAGLGIATFLTVYLHIQRLEAPTESAVLLVVFGVLLSGPLVVGGLWLLRTEFTPAQAIRITGWVILGSGPLLMVTFLLITFSGSLTVVLGDPFVLLSGLVALGGLSGLAFGFYELELRSAKARVQATANRLEAIISGSPIPIVAVDAAGSITMWNPAAAETFKYEAEAVLGERYPLAPDDREGEVDQHLEQLREGEELAGVQTVRERQDGVRLDVELWTARLVDDAGAFEGAVVLIVDISDRKRREQEVQVLHRILRHNLRNDLNVIQGNAARVDEALQPLQELSDRLGDRVRAESGPTGPGEGTVESGRPSVRDIHASLIASVPDTIDHTRLMRRKADELVTLTEKTQQAEAILRSSEDEHRPVELSQLVDDPVANLLIEYPSATVTVDVDEGVYALVNGPIGIAVRELVENAILYADSESSLVEVVASRDGDRVSIEVHDEGPGIPTEERRVLAEGKESAMLHSSGLGLWMANWLVNRSGGTLSFEEEHTGCIARIEIPAADAAPTAD